MATDASWTVSVEEDTTTGDLYLPFPNDMLEKLGWVEGDTLEWSVNDNGSFTLTKKENGSNIKQ